MPDIPDAGFKPTYEEKLRVPPGVPHQRHLRKLYHYNIYLEDISTSGYHHSSQAALADWQHKWGIEFQPQKCSLLTGTRS